MTDQVIRADLPAVSGRAAISAVTAGAVYLLLIAVGARLLNDPDTYWHIAVGRWILDHGAVPHTDPFSFTMAGAPWIAKEWLAQLIYLGAQTVGGWTGVVVVAATAIALAFGLLAHGLFERLPPIPALAFVLVALVLTAPHLVARPHALALPLMVAWTAGLVRAVERGSAPKLWLALLMLPWANLHGGFTLGLALIVPFAIETVMQAPMSERRSLALAWLRFALASLAAACITPYGPESILVTQRILGLGPALALINEWQPQDFGRLAAFELVLLAGIGLALLRGVALPPIRILVLLGLLHLALAHARNAELLGLIGPLILASPLCKILGNDRPPMTFPTTLDPRVALATIAALLFAATGVLASSRPLAPDPANTPAAAIAALKQAHAGAVFNDYEFGGFLIANGVAPFIDGRTELYGGAFLARQHRAVTLQNLPDFLEMLDQYGIDATLLSPGRPAVALLDRLPGWKRLSADDVAVVHMRIPQP